MPRKLKEKTLTKLVSYLKEDRPRKFKACLSKYDVDVRDAVLPKGRTLLHCAAKHGCGYFISYLLAHGASAAQRDDKGDLPLHLALHRALRLPPQEAVDVYSQIVIPLLKDYPDAVNFCAGDGRDVCSLLAALNQHIRSQDDSSSDSSDSSDSEMSDSCSSSSSCDDWGDRLAQEFENESSDFFGRYNYSDDFDRERGDESYNEWSERLNREMRDRRRYRPGTGGPHRPGTSDTQAPGSNNKRKHPSANGGTSHPKTPRGSNTKEEILKAKAAQNLDRQRKTYEERFQAAVSDKSGRKLSYSDIPWPSKGSLGGVMDVLFGDKTDWSPAALKKYVREQQVRWHPDKFLQKFIDKIAPKSFEKVMERVKELSQALNKKAESLSAG